MVSGIIYKCECTLTHKCYIGQTIQKLTHRISAHKSLSESASNTQHFYNAIRKYGWNNFSWSILETIRGEKEDVCSKLDKLEIFYIQKFNSLKNGYNQTRGGQYSRFEEYPVTVYNLFGEKIGDYSGSLEVSNIFGVFRKMVQKACRNKKSIFRSDMNFPIVCRYKNDHYTQDEIKSNLLRFYHKIVDVYCDGQIIDTFFSQAQCSRKYDIDVGSLCALCNHKESWDVVRNDKHIVFKFREL